MKIYLAGPLGFSEAGRFFYYQELVPKLKALGFTVFDPWVRPSKEQVEAIANMPDGPARREAWRKLNATSATDNIVELDDCDAVLAVLDGTDVDSGTAAEIGYAFARNKPILGYRGDFRLSSDNEGGIVNLQVEYFIRKSGGDIIRSIAELPQALEKIAARVPKRK